MSSPTLMQRLTRTQLGLVLGFQLITMTAGGLLVGWPLMASGARDLAALIMLSAKSWRELPPERRPALQAELADHRGLVLAEATTPLDTDRPWLPYLNALEHFLSTELGAPVRVSRGHDTDYAVDIPLGEQWLRFGFDHRRLGANPVTAFALILIGSLLLALLAARPLSRRLTRPLRDLASAAHAVGRGRVPRLAIPDGIDELRALTESFNAMATQVQQLLASRNTLLAGVSHDLRTPIARMQMAVELQRSGLPVTVARRLDDNLAQMNGLVQEFLDFSAGVAATDRQPVAIRALVEDVVHAMPEPLHRYDITGDDVTITISPTALRRVLDNLLQNTHRYGGGQVAIRIDDHDGALRITLDDRGPGIPAADRGRVLQAFVRLEGSRNRGSGGSGLGLAIVQDICLANDWALSLGDAPGGGLRVRLILPAPATTDH